MNGYRIIYPTTRECRQFNSFRPTHGSHSHTDNQRTLLFHSKRQRPNGSVIQCSLRLVLSLSYLRNVLIIIIHVSLQENKIVKELIKTSKHILAGSSRQVPVFGFVCTFDVVHIVPAAHSCAPIPKPARHILRSRPDLELIYN